MWFKLWQCVVKEFKLLFRDIGGLITLFIMPVILVVVVTSIQDSTYQSFSASKIPVLWIDHDQDSISLHVKKELEASQSFSLITTENNKAITEVTAKELVFKGKYQMAIVIPKNLTSDLNIKVRQNVDGLLDEMGMSTSTYDPVKVEKKEIRLYFDPATQAAFKNGIKSNIDKMVAQLESDAIYKTFETQLGGSSSTSFNDTFISFKEIVPQEKNADIVPNSVQHNVPAWTLFAIFFIMVPLSINIVKEKNQGTYLRLISSPTSNNILYLGKIITYLVICLLQFYTILIIAKVVFPYMNLPELNLSFKKIALMSALTLTAGLAAIGMAILLGIVSKTQEQSAPFGATFVIILAAVGGVWIPVFAMSQVMQVASKASPMNWALNGYYDIILRNGSLIDIIPEMILLTLFFVVFTTCALLYDKKKRTV